MFKWLCMRSLREHWVQSGEWEFSKRHVEKNCIRTSLAVVVQRDAKQPINVTRNATARRALTPLTELPLGNS